MDNRFKSNSFDVGDLIQVPPEDEEYGGCVLVVTNVLRKKLECLLLIQCGRGFPIVCEPDKGERCGSIKWFPEVSLTKPEMPKSVGLRLV